MTYCLCRRHVMLGAGALLAPRGAAAQSASHGALFNRLRSAGALDPYVNEGLTEIVSTLARAMRVPGGAAVNAEPGPGGIMVVVLRPETERPDRVGDVVVPRGLAATPKSDPDGRVVWVDADYLRGLAAEISLSMGKSMGGGGLRFMQAVAKTMLTPLPELANWWREGASPALTHETQVLVSRGAGGFVLAHEMAHVLLGAPPTVAAALSSLPRRARQLAPMCPELSDPSVIARRDYEMRADALALRAVLDGGRALGQAAIGLPGELGIKVLLGLLLARDMLWIGTVVERPLTHRMVEMQIGADNFARLRAQVTPRAGTDMMGMLYTDTHPAAVQRIRAVERSLSAMPGSMFHGEAEDPAMGMMMQLIERECAEIVRGLAPGGAGAGR